MQKRTSYPFWQRRRLCRDAELREGSPVNSSERRPNKGLEPTRQSARLMPSVRHPSRSEALDPTVTELLPHDTQPPPDTDHQVLPSLSDPKNIRRTMNEALNKYARSSFLHYKTEKQVIVGECTSVTPRFGIRSRYQREGRGLPALSRQ